MQYTENLNLTKYEANDPTNWLVAFNTNMDKIDSGVGNVANELTEVESDVSTAISTANSASTTASNALTVANSKTSIDDLATSASTTYSSNKINELISGIQPGIEIDDTVTSTTKTWSSSKINTELNSKASINDTIASNTTTYSSNKIDELLSYNNYHTFYDNETSESNEYNYDHDITINEDGFYIIESVVNAIVSDSTTTSPAKLFTLGESAIILKRNNTSKILIGGGYKLSSLDFTNITEPRYINNRKNIIFKNNVSVFLKAGDIINISNVQAGSELWGTWKFTSKVNIIKFY